MSLTSFLRNDHELRVLIDQTFERPSVDESFDRLAEPQTPNYALIGTAFDYVIRFWLEHQYGVSSKPWIAHQGYSIASIIPEEEHDIADDVDIHEVFNNIESIHEDFVDDGELTDKLLAITLDLARFDWVYRSGQPLKSLTVAAEGDVTDLRNLYDVLPKQEFQELNDVLLNPTFGSASELVNGADADLILDGLLLDIKTVKDASLKPDYWRQLVGYAILADLVSDELDEIDRVDRIGVYFSRHGEVWSTSANRIYESEKYDQFKSWFQERAVEHFSD